MTEVFCEYFRCVPLPVLFGQILLGLINGSFYALLSLGLAVIFGLLRVINFAHGAQYMVGAFLSLLLLNQFGVRTYRQLADTPVERLREILTNAGPQLAMHDPGTWPSQANLAANDQWDALKSIQGFLKGGKKPN